MAPALLTSIINYSQNTFSSPLYSTDRSQSPSQPRTTIPPALPSPSSSTYSSTSSSNDSGSLTPTQASASQSPSATSLAMYAEKRLQKKRSNSSLRVSPTLPDISEVPTATTTTTMHSSKTSTSRKMSPGRPLSVLSEVSVSSADSEATIDGYKFRFVNDEETESVFEGSVFDGLEGDDDYRKAEKVLAGVKQKLHAFESNITRARDSLAITTGPVTSNPVSPTPDTNHTYRLRSYTRVPSRNKMYMTNSHTRAFSEGQKYAGMHARQESFSTQTSSSSDHYTDAASTYRSGSAMSNSRTSSRASSTQQVRDLQDQMNSLHGKITQLTEKTRRESLRRRSMNNMRGTPLNNIFQPPEPVFKNPEASASTSSFHTAQDDDLNSESEYGSRSGTPKPYPPLRKSMSYEELGYDTAFSTPGEEPSNLIISPRKNRVRAYRSNSSSGSSTRSGVTTPLSLRQIPQRMQISRNNSASSLASFETAQEDSEDGIIVTPLTHRPYHKRIPSKTSPLRAIVDEADYEDEIPNGQSSPSDGGYHSGPSTPQGLDSASDIDGGVYLPLQGIKQDTTLPLTKETLQQLDVPTQSAAKAATNSIIGAENDELALKLPIEDRQLVENLCDQLGKVCCRMETAATQQDRDQIRKRMEVALMVLQGITNF